MGTAAALALPRVELVGVVATGLLHVLFQAVGAKGVFIALACVSYIRWWLWRCPSLWKQWGFRTDNFKPSLYLPTVLSATTVIMMALFALISGHRLWNEYIILLLLRYPLWEVLQQFLVQAMGVANLRTLYPNASMRSVVVLGSCLFSIVHFPEEWLMFGTWLMGCVFIPYYL